MRYPRPNSLKLFPNCSHQGDEVDSFSALGSQLQNSRFLHFPRPVPPHPRPLPEGEGRGEGERSVAIPRGVRLLQSPLGFRILSPASSRRWLRLALFFHLLEKPGTRE